MLTKWQQSKLKFMPTLMLYVGDIVQVRYEGVKRPAKINAEIMVSVDWTHQIGEYLAPLNDVRFLGFRCRGKPPVMTRLMLKVGDTVLVMYDDVERPATIISEIMISVDWADGSGQCLAPLKDVRLIEDDDYPGALDYAPGKQHTLLVNRYYRAAPMLMGRKSVPFAYPPRSMIAFYRVEINGEGWYFGTNLKFWTRDRLISLEDFGGDNLSICVGIATHCKKWTIWSEDNLKKIEWRISYDLEFDDEFEFTITRLTEKRNHPCNKEFRWLVTFGPECVSNNLGAVYTHTHFPDSELQSSLPNCRRFSN